MLPYFRRVVTVPGVVTRFPPFDFIRSPVNPVAVDYRTCLGIAAAFGVVIFAEDKLKVHIRRFLITVSDAIQ